MIDHLDAERDFEEFVVACWPRLCRAAYLLTGDRSDAEDLAQTAYARTYAAWSRPDVAAILRHGRRLRWRRRAGAVTLAAARSLAIAHRRSWPAPSASVAAPAEQGRSTRRRCNPVGAGERL